MKLSFLILGAATLILVVGVFVFVPAGRAPELSVARMDARHPDEERKEPARSPMPDKTVPADSAAIRERFAGKEVERVPTEEKLIALTFDGGGNANGTERILDILASHDIRSTFFLTGRFLERYPDQVKAIVGAGHEIANHTLSHRNFKELTGEEMFLEITGAHERARSRGVAFVPFFRFPYGEYKKGDIALVNDSGYTAVRWTVDSWGWKGAGNGVDALFVAQKVIDAAKPGAIALMHLGSAKDGSTLDADALPEIIRTLSTNGYRFVTLSELFSAVR